MFGCASLGGGEGKQLATQIAAHVSNALDAAKTDHFRYSSAQRAASAAVYMQRASNKHN